jgi:hypothetical protein
VLKHIELACGQILLTEMFSHDASHVRGDVPLAGGHSTDDPEEFVFRGALRDVGGSACP